MSRSPAAARRQLGTKLRRLRDAAGKKTEDAAEALDCSTAKISRLENGRGVPFARDVRDLIDLYEARHEAAELFALVEEGRAQDWFDEFKDVIQGEMFPSHLLRYAELERDAAALTYFEPELIPGPLQTEEYVDAVLQAVFPTAPENERARLVEFRMQRQQKLLHQGLRPDVTFVLGELAIVRSIGDPDILRRQLEHLVTQLEGPLSEVSFYLSPLTNPDPAALGGPFVILRFDDRTEQDRVYLEGRDGATWLESDSDVLRYEEKFESLERASGTRGDALKRLSDRIDQLR